MNHEIPKHCGIKVCNLWGKLRIIEVPDCLSVHTTF